MLRRGARPQGGTLSSTRWRLGLAVLGLVNLAVHLAIALPQRWFSVLPDEAGYLGNARWLTGGGEWPMGAAPRYGIGTSVLYVPATVIGGDDPALVVRLAALTNAVLLAALAPLLALAVRRLTGCSGAVALMAGAVAAVTPIAMLGGTVLWAEPAVIVAVVGLVVGLGRKPTRPWVAVLIGVMPWIHLRVLPFVLAGVIALIWQRRHRLLIVAAAVSAVGAIAQWAVERARWTTVVGPPLTDGLGEPGSALTQVLGEGWYLLVSTAGMAALGAAVLWKAAQRGDSTAALVGAAASVLMALSAVSSAASAHRPEQYVYGRYVDAVGPLLTALGVVWLQRVSVKGRRAGALAVIGASVLAISIVGAVRGADAFDGGWQTSQVLGVAWAVGDGGTRVLWLATVVCAVVVVSWAVVPARAGAIVVAGVLVVASALAWTGPVEDRRTQYDGWSVPDAIAALDVDSVGYDSSAANPVGQWAYPLLFGDVSYTPFDGEVPSGVEAVVGSLDRPPFDTAPAVSDDRFGLGVWLVDP